jgi:hypothetical protein
VEDNRSTAGGGVTKKNTKKIIKPRNKHRNKNIN